MKKKKVIKINNKKNIKNSKKNIKNNKKIVKEKVKVRKIRYGRVLLFLIILFLIGYLIFSFINLKIKNIYIINNNILSDYEIIELASLEDYPPIFYQTSSSIEKTLEKNIFIKKAKVKKSYRRIDINIEDNYPVYYDSNTNKTVFQDKREDDKVYATPILVNYVPDTISDEFKTKLLKLDINVINRISEIKYDPNNVDSERFLLTMNDGNFVYLTLAYFDKMNSYVSIYLDIISKYGYKNGILYLDSGEYFKIM